MLNEKKIMADKLYIFTVLAIMSGFFIGVSLVMFVASVGPEELIYSVLIGAVLFIAAGIVFIVMANTLHRQLRKYIMSPYVKMEDEDDQQTQQSDELLDPSAN